jgi:hypothetical protein
MRVKLTVPAFGSAVGRLHDGMAALRSNVNDWQALVFAISDSETTIPSRLGV